MLYMFYHSHKCKTYCSLFAMAGIDHCWPEDTRCDPGEWCVNHALTYECKQSNKREFWKYLNDLSYRE